MKKWVSSIFKKKNVPNWSPHTETETSTNTKSRNPKQDKGPRFNHQSSTTHTLKSHLSLYFCGTHKLPLSLSLSFWRISATTALESKTKPRISSLSLSAAEFDLQARFVNAGTYRFAFQFQFCFKALQFFSFRVWCNFFEFVSEKP